ncbi:MAG: polysaccharide deacetylase family protein, partial [Atopobiaceae bacterium]|nr:polysaccharide deacetylase family protein [Atopobiaceae bacterium]
GEQIAWYPDQIAREKALGCQICTHTWDHASGSGQGVNITYMSADEQIWEVTEGFKAIADATGEEPSHILRAPGGNFYGDAVTNLWPYLDAEIGWDLDTEDWALPGSDAIASVLMSAQPGQVILMHDGGGDRWQTVEGLRQAMPYLVEQGYSFVTIDELLAYGVPE